MQFKVRLKKFINRDGDTSLKEHNEGVIFWDDVNGTAAIYSHGHCWTHITNEFQKDNTAIANGLVGYLKERKRSKQPITDIIVTFNSTEEHTMAQVVNYEIDDIKPRVKPEKVKVDPAVYLAIEGFGLF